MDEMTGCDCEWLNPIADIGDIRCLVPTFSLAPQFAGSRIEPPSPQNFFKHPLRGRQDL